LDAIVVRRRDWFIGETRNRYFARFDFGFVPSVMSFFPFAGWEVLPYEGREFFVRRKLSFPHARFDYEFLDAAVVAHVSLREKPHNYVLCGTSPPKPLISRLMCTAKAFINLRR